MFEYDMHTIYIQNDIKIQNYFFLFIKIEQYNTKTQVKTIRIFPKNALKNK